MQIIETGLVIGANRYKVNSSSGGALYLLQENHGENDQLIGLEVKKIDMPYSMFDQFKTKKLPGEYEILVEAERGGQDEAKITAISSRHLPQDEQSIDRILTLFANPVNQRSNQHENRPQQSAAVMLVLSASCYVMEEENMKGGRVYLGQMSSGKNSDQIGLEVIKLRMPYDLFSELKGKTLPGEYLVNLRLERGARDKGRYRAVGVSGDNQLTKERLLDLMGYKPLLVIPNVIKVEPPNLDKNSKS